MVYKFHAQGLHKHTYKRQLAHYKRVNKLKNETKMTDISLVRSNIAKAPFGVGLLSWGLPTWRPPSFSGVPLSVGPSYSGLGLTDELGSDVPSPGFAVPENPA